LDRSEEEEVEDEEEGEGKRRVVRSRVAVRRMEGGREGRRAGPWERARKKEASRGGVRKGRREGGSGEEKRAIAARRV